MRNTIRMNSAAMRVNTTPTRTLAIEDSSTMKPPNGLIAIAPIYLVFTNALKTVTDASSMNAQPPLNPQWSNFGAVIDPPSSDVTAHVVEMLAGE